MKRSEQGHWQNEISNMESWSFGDGPEMADELGRLVVEGKKTATSSLLQAYIDEDESLPKVGDRSCIKNSKNEPLCVIENRQVIVQKFSEADDRLAIAEGEGDLSLNYWQKEHRKFFRRSHPCFHDEMEIVSEYFEVLYVFP